MEPGRIHISRPVLWTVNEPHDAEVDQKLDGFGEMLG